MSAGREGLKITIILSLLISSWIILFIPKTLDATVYGKIYGRVVKEDTGEGLKDFIVLLYHYYENRFYEIDRIHTDKDGKFAFDRIKEGRYSLVFVADWECGYFIHESADPEIIKENAFNVKKGQHYKIEKKALLGGELRVFVKNSYGTEFICPSNVDFFIELIGESGMPYGYGPHQNPARPGEYYLKMPPGTYRCEVHVDGYPTQKAKDIRIEKGKIETREFTVDLNDSTGIEGTVISSEDGSPISEIWLAVYDENTNEEICTMRSDDNGHYVVVGLAPGKYRIFCTYPYKTFKGIIVTEGKKTWFEIKIEYEQVESILPISSSGTMASGGPFFFTSQKLIPQIQNININFLPYSKDSI
jgi:5-hydroxyisourate hydrolase-like protein (transthyretin family)